MPDEKIQPKDGATPPPEPPMPSPIMLKETFTATREVNTKNNND